MVRIAGLVFSSLLLLATPFESKSQQHSAPKRAYGITAGFGLSGYHYAISVGYAGPPFFTDLSVVDEPLPSYNISVFKSYYLARAFNIEQAIGYSSFGYRTNYNYDLENSINNIVSTNRTFEYLNLTHRLNREFKISDKFALSLLAGLSINYLLKSQAEHINSVNGVNKRTVQNMTTMEPRFNFGYEIGTALSFAIKEDISLQLRPTYSKLIKPIDNEQKRIFYYGLALGVIKKF